MPVLPHERNPDSCQAIPESSSQIEAAVKAAGNMAMGKGIEGIDGAQADGKYILLPFENLYPCL